MASAISTEVPHAPPEAQPSLRTAWGSKNEQCNVAVSLDDVMNEELSMAEGFGQATGGSNVDMDTTSDELLAQLLQYEYDEESTNVADKKTQEEVTSRKSESAIATVDVGFDPFRLPQAADDSDDDDTREWDTFAAGTKFTVGKQGFAKSKGPQSKVLSTKHDAAVCGRRNACRVMVRSLYQYPILRNLLL